MFSYYTVNQHMWNPDTGSQTHETDNQNPSGPSLVLPKPTFFACTWEEEEQGKAPGAEKDLEEKRPGAQPASLP